jgi:hypothetical protein
MHRALLLIPTVSMGLLLGCSDRSPTSPRMGTDAPSLKSVEAPPLKAAQRDRHPVVVPPRSDGFLQPGIWGSDKASLTVTKDAATLQILSATLPTGGLFGSYGEITQAIPNGSFSISGTYTQLTGVYPGKIQYSASYSGIVQDARMSISITVPALSQTIGPFPLA